MKRVEPITSPSMHSLFAETLEQFEPLRNHEIQLRCRKIKNSTMQAQPVFEPSFFLPQTRRYQVHYTPFTKIDPTVKTESLPEDVLKGWFAHELGHIMDYRDRSWISMIYFGMTYLASSRLRGAHERTADLYALRFGFKREILATKEFILDHSSLDGKYRKQIMKYYLSPEEIETIALEHAKAHDSLS